MAELRLDFPLIRNSNSQLLQQTNKLSNIRMNVSSLRHGVDSSITARRGIGMRMNRAVQSLEEVESDLRRLHTFLEQSVERYQQAEDRICRDAQLIGNVPTTTPNSTDSTVNPSSTSDHEAVDKLREYLEAALESTNDFLSNALDSEKLLRLADGLGFRFVQRGGNIRLKIVEWDLKLTWKNIMNQARENFINKSDWVKYDLKVMRNKGQPLYNTNTNKYTKEAEWFKNSKLKSLDKHIDQISKPRWKNSIPNGFETFKDNIRVWDDFTGWKNASNLTRTGKVFGLAGNLFSIGNNIHDNFYDKNQGEWVFNSSNTTKFITDTVVDVGSGAAAMAAGAAVGSLILPPIGTVVGFGVGAALNFGMNVPISALGDKSLVDYTKEKVNQAVDKVADFFGKIFW